MKKTSLIAFVLSFIIISCNTSSENSSEASEFDNINEPISFVDEAKYAEDWDNFRMGIVNNDSDFDWYKFVEIEGQDPYDYASFFEDDYTKLVLENTTYDQLEDAQYFGNLVKAFYVIIAADNDMYGNVYYFKEGGNGLSLVGFEDYQP
jgi:hypothetical protein